MALNKKQKQLLTNAGAGLASGTAQGFALADIKDTSAEEALIDSVESTQFSGGFDSLLESFDATNLAKTNYKASDVRGMSEDQMWGNILGSTASGALSGGLSGGWLGALVEGGSNLIGGLIGKSIGDSKAEAKAVELNRIATDANRQYLNNFNNAVANTQNKMFNNSLLNISKDGGKIFTKFESKNNITSLKKKTDKWHYAYGGPLNEFSGNFSNGLTFINEGGTHESNPFEGVQVGVDYNNVPNLVEEGEVIYNNYVFSNRLKPTKKQLEDNGLNKKYEDWTFAKIIEDVQKESSNNPIDFISQNTLEDMIGILTNMQEEIRMKKNKTTNKFDIGGYLRYAPILADTLGLIHNVSSQPDYSNANAGLEAMKRVRNVSATPIGGKQSYDLIDPNYLLNKQLGVSASASRAIQNNAINPGQAIAGLTNLNLNTQTGMADTMLQINRENQARKMQTAAFNLGIDQFNTQQDMQAQQLNQNVDYNIAQAAERAALQRSAIDAQKNQAISQNISGITDTLAGIGTESTHETWLKGLIDSGAIYDYLNRNKKSTDTETTTPNNSGKNGGKFLTRRRK